MLISFCVKLIVKFEECPLLCFVGKTILFFYPEFSWPCHSRRKQAVTLPCFQRQRGILHRGIISHKTYKSFTLPLFSLRLRSYPLFLSVLIQKFLRMVVFYSSWSDLTCSPNIDHDSQDGSRVLWACSSLKASGFGLFFPLLASTSSFFFRWVFCLASYHCHGICTLVWACSQING